MADKTKTEPAPPKEVVEGTNSEPLLDLSYAAVKKLVSSAKKRGYVNAAL
jgi:hypothetical protein